MTTSDLVDCTGEITLYMVHAKSFCGVFFESRYPERCYPVAQFDGHHGNSIRIVALSILLCLLKLSMNLSEYQ